MRYLYTLLMVLSLFTHFPAMAVDQPVGGGVIDGERGWSSEINTTWELAPPATGIAEGWIGQNGFIHKFWKDDNDVQFRQGDPITTITDASSAMTNIWFAQESDWTDELASGLDWILKEGTNPTMHQYEAPPNEVQAVPAGHNSTINQYSVLFDGENCLQLDTPTALFGSGTTLDFWMYIDNESGSQAFMAASNVIGEESIVFFAPSGRIDINFLNGAGADTDITINDAFTGEQWNHFRFEFQAGNIVTFVNGTLESTDAWTAASWPSEQVTLGCALAGSNNMHDGTRVFEMVYDDSAVTNGAPIAGSTYACGIYGDADGTLRNAFHTGAEGPFAGTYPCDYDRP